MAIFMATIAFSLSLRAESSHFKSAYDFSFTAIDDQPMALNQFRGKVLLIVNTASECGFTDQYRELQDLWDCYRAKDLIVIGVPSNDFGNQEPGSNATIEKFCHSKFHATFPMTAKTSVRGKNAHPFYRWAKSKTWFSPRWNFHKYLIDRQGQVVGNYFSWTHASSPKIKKAIERELVKSTKALSK